MAIGRVTPRRLGEANEGSAGHETADCMSSVDDGAGRDGRPSRRRPSSCRSGSARRASKFTPPRRPRRRAGRACSVPEKRPRRWGRGQRAAAAAARRFLIGGRRACKPNNSRLGFGKAATAPGGRNAGVVETEASTGGANARRPRVGAPSPRRAPSKASSSSKCAARRPLGARSQITPTGSHADCAGDDGG